MHFSVLHISDLHRDPQDPIGNGPLLDSLLRDIERFESQDPPITRPSVCVVSGDLAYGVPADCSDPDSELSRQYDQAIGFLTGLSDKFFSGDRNRIILLPGNHDVSYPAVIASGVRIDIPVSPADRRLLTTELFASTSRLRWSWSEMCFYRITDTALYDERLANFARAYHDFYAGARSFSLSPEEQFEIFDYPDLEFSILALNSCHRNDPLQRAGSFNPTALSSACARMRIPSRTGWLLAASWHHSIGGGPLSNDYLNGEFLQLLIDSGISIGLHGHQHSHDCIDERYRLGPGPRKITIISASTLCSDARQLRPGVPRGFNVVELDTDTWTGRTHSRHMVNHAFDLPVWGPGHFYATGKAYVDFELCKPLGIRSNQLDATLALERADRLLGARQWAAALEVLRGVKHLALARPMIHRALTELGDDAQTIETLWPPATIAETVLLGAAVLNRGNHEEANAFLRLDAVSGSSDASITEIRRRVARLSR